MWQSWKRGCCKERGARWKRPRTALLPSPPVSLPEWPVKIEIRLRLRSRKRWADAVIHTQPQQQMRALQAVDFRRDHCRARGMCLANEREQGVGHRFRVAEFG